MSAPFVLVLQGPNLDRLGTREPQTYGSGSLEELQAQLDGVAREIGVTLRHVQSSHEGVLIDAIHAAADDGAIGAVVNAGAYSHTSIGLRDAILSVSLPTIEVHLSNVYAREPFRHHSVLADICVGVIVGLGREGYCAALRALVGRRASG